MKILQGLVLLISIVSFVFLSGNLIYAQEEPVETATLEPQMQWLWGEVTAVDIAKQQITVKYLDYETDTEKEMVVTADSQTKYENVNSIEEIKAQDALSVDYITSDNNNIAKVISVEKTENIEGLTEETPPTTE